MPAIACGETGATDDGSTRKIPFGPINGRGYLTVVVDVEDGLPVEKAADVTVGSFELESPEAAADDDEDAGTSETGASVDFELTADSVDTPSDDADESAVVGKVVNG